MLGNEVEFYLQKSVWSFETPSKNYGQKLERVWKCQKNVPSNPSLKFDNNF